MPLQRSGFQPHAAASTRPNADYSTTVMTVPLPTT